MSEQIKKPPANIEPMHKEPERQSSLETKQESKDSKPELFIGLVSGVGTDLDQVVSGLTNALSQVGYASREIKLSALLRDLPSPKKLRTRFRDEYLNDHMQAGDDFRRSCRRSDAVALLGVARIKSLRDSKPSSEGVAYIIRSLKNPEEVKTLRKIYGDSFYLVGVYAPLEDRRQRLAKQIAESRNDYPIAGHLKTADSLIERDQAEDMADYGQQSRDSIHRADIFLDAREKESLPNSISRFVQLLFGNTFHTPTKQEYGMFMAHAAALRSSELGRQVGAAIVDDEGEVVTVGCNEVPKADGGLYWADDKPDKREFHNSIDTSDQQKRNMIAETLRFLRKADWFKSSIQELEDTDLLEQAIGENKPALPKESQIRNVIEYGRAVHGEMAAITNAARKGIAIRGCWMYVTTFPCHLCARHIVSAGITKVIYVEPYPKSMAAELYLDSISVDGEDKCQGRVPFEPFVGVAPRQYQNLFTAGTRKAKNGTIKKFSRDLAKLRYYELPDIYKSRELQELKPITDIVKGKSSIKTGEE